MAEETTTTNQLNAYTVEQYDADNGKKARRWTHIGTVMQRPVGTPPAITVSPCSNC